MFPPVARLYQFIEPAEVVALLVRVPASQQAADEVEVIVELPTVAIMAVRVGLAQPFAIAST
jgi:hypothetical protein